VAFGVWEDCVDPMLAGKRYDKEIWFYGVGLMVLCLIALVGTLHMTRAAL
jgi:hypothetical protein